MQGQDKGGRVDSSQTKANEFQMSDIAVHHAEIITLLSDANAHCKVCLIEDRKTNQKQKKQT